MKKRILALAVCCLAIPLMAQSAIDYSKDVGSPLDGVLRASSIPGMQEAYLPVIQPSSHAANLIVLKDGTTLCFWFTGTWEGNTDVGIAVSRLAPGSKQWSVPIMIDHQSGYSFQNPVPFQAPDGTVWLFHSRQPANQGETDARVLLVKSHDDGKTWGSPVVLFDTPGAFSRNPIVIRPDHAWLLPMYYEPGANRQATTVPVVKLSHDDGKSWTDCKIPNSAGLIQPSVVRLHNGHYIAVLRDTRAVWIYQSSSSDGCAWSAPTPTKLPNNDASVQLALLKDGNVVLVFNDSAPVMRNGKLTAGPRKPLTIAMSDDGGKTWKWKRDIETGRPDATVALEKEKLPGREAYGYPTVTQLANGKIGVAYTYRRETIKFVTFDESWIKNGGK